MVGWKAGLLAPLLASAGCCSATITGVVTGVGVVTGAGSNSTGGTSASSSGGSTTAGATSSGSTSGSQGTTGSTGAGPVCVPGPASDLSSHATYTPVLGSLTSVDLNGDGMLDLLGWDVFGGTFSVFLGLPDGKLGAPATYPGGVTFGVGDLNGDGRPDVVVASTSGVGASRNGVEIYLNDGGGGLLPSGSVPTAQPVFRIAIGDLNNDGFADLALGEEGPFADGGLLTSGTAEMAFGDGSGGFSTPIALPGLGYPIVVADLNQDGLADIAGNTSEGAQLAVLINQGDGGFLTTLYATSALGDMVLLPRPGGPPDLVLGDTGYIFEDGVDVFFSGGIQVLKNTGDGTFAISPNLEVPGGMSIAIGDFNGDCIPDIVTASSLNQCSSWAASVLYGNGDGGFESAVSLPAVGYVDTVAALGLVESPRALAAETDGCFDAGIVVYGNASKP